MSIVRRVVTFVNSWSRLFASSPTEIIEGRAPDQLEHKIKGLSGLKQTNLIYEQQLKALRANANQFDSARYKLHHDYWHNNMNEDQFLKQSHRIDDMEKQARIKERGL